MWPTSGPRHAFNSYSRCLSSTQYENNRCCRRRRRMAAGRLENCRLQSAAGPSSGIQTGRIYTRGRYKSSGACGSSASYLFVPWTRPGISRAEPRTPADPCQSAPRTTASSHGIFHRTHATGRRGYRERRQLESKDTVLT